jgi:hypothetical protein
MTQNIQVNSDSSITIQTTNDPIVIIETHTPDEIQVKIDALTKQQAESNQQFQDQIDMWNSVLDNQDVQALVQQLKANPPVKVIDSSTPQ